MSNNHGFTYIEVLMASVILSLCITPALAGFLNASQNQRYSQEVYIASLYANNMLIDAQNTTDFAALFASPAFDTEYKTDSFDYGLYIYDSTSYGLELEYYIVTSPSIELPLTPVLNGTMPSLPPMPEISGDTTIELYGDETIYISGGPATVVCINNSGASAILNIYSDAPDTITIDSRPLTADISIFLHELPPRERIVMVEVYNKAGLLLNRLAVPIVLDWQPE